MRHRHLGSETETKRHRDGYRDGETTADVVVSATVFGPRSPYYSAHMNHLRGRASPRCLPEVLFASNAAHTKTYEDDHDDGGDLDHEANATPAPPPPVASTPEELRRLAHHEVCRHRDQNQDLDLDSGPGPGPVKSDPDATTKHGSGVLDLSTTDGGWLGRGGVGVLIAYQSGRVVLIRGLSQEGGSETPLTLSSRSISTTSTSPSPVVPHPIISWSAVALAVSKGDTEADMGSHRPWRAATGWVGPQETLDVLWTVESVANAATAEEKRNVEVRSVSFPARALAQAFDETRAKRAAASVGKDVQVKEEPGNGRNAGFGSSSQMGDLSTLPTLASPLPFPPRMAGTGPSTGPPPSRLPRARVVPTEAASLVPADVVSLVTVRGSGPCRVCVLDYPVTHTTTSMSSTTAPQVPTTVALAARPGGGFPHVTVAAILSDGRIETLVVDVLQGRPRWGSARQITTTRFRTPLPTPLSRPYRHERHQPRRRPPSPPSRLILEWSGDGSVVAVSTTAVVHVLQYADDHAPPRHMAAVGRTNTTAAMVPSASGILLASAQRSRGALDVYLHPLVECFGLEVPLALQEGATTVLSASSLSSSSPTSWPLSLLVAAARDKDAKNAAVTAATKAVLCGMFVGWSTRGARREPQATNRDLQLGSDLDLDTPTAAEVIPRTVRNLTRAALWGRIVPGGARDWILYARRILRAAWRSIERKRRETATTTTVMTDQEMLENDGDDDGDKNWRLFVLQKVLVAIVRVSVVGVPPADLTLRPGEGWEQHARRLRRYLNFDPMYWYDQAIIQLTSVADEFAPRVEKETWQHIEIGSGSGSGSGAPNLRTSLATSTTQTIYFSLTTARMNALLRRLVTALNTTWSCARWVPAAEDQGGAQDPLAWQRLLIAQLQGTFNVCLDMYEALGDVAPALALHRYHSTASSVPISSTPDSIKSASNMASSAGGTAFSADDSAAGANPARISDPSRSSTRRPPEMVPLASLVADPAFRAFLVANRYASLRYIADIVAFAAERRESAVRAATKDLPPVRSTGAANSRGGDYITPEAKAEVERNAGSRWVALEQTWARTGQRLELALRQIDELMACVRPLGQGDEIDHADHDHDKRGEAGGRDGSIGGVGEPRKEMPPPTTTSTAARSPRPHPLSVTVTIHPIVAVPVHHVHLKSLVAWCRTHRPTDPATLALAAVTESVTDTSAPPTPSPPVSSQVVGEAIVRAHARVAAVINVGRQVQWWPRPGPDGHVLLANTNTGYGAKTGLLDIWTMRGGGGGGGGGGIDPYHAQETTETKTIARGRRPATTTAFVVPMRGPEWSGREGNFDAGLSALAEVTVGSPPWVSEGTSKGQGSNRSKRRRYERDEMGGGTGSGPRLQDSLPTAATTMTKMTTTTTAPDVNRARLNKKDGSGMESGATVTFTPAEAERVIADAIYTSRAMVMATATADGGGDVAAEAVVDGGDDDEDNEEYIDHFNEDEGRLARPRVAVPVTWEVWEGRGKVKGAVVLGCVWCGSVRTEVAEKAGSRVEGRPLVTMDGEWGAFACWMGKGGAVRGGGCGACGGVWMPMGLAEEGRAPV